MTENKAQFNFSDLFIIFGPRALVNVSDDIKIQGISTDSRNIKRLNAFVALRGDNYDGHDFISDVEKKEASVIFCSNSWFQKNRDKARNLRLVIVKSGLEALQKLATYHRERFDIPVVAIAGSNGKTTTKDLTASVLSKKYKVLKTQKNLNNQIGVPLTLLKIDESHTAAVIEIGTSQYGEISILSKMVKPTHGLVTNIAEEHLEYLIDLDGVELEETALYAWCRQNNSYSIINLEDKRLIKYVKALEKRITFGRHLESNLRIKSAEETTRMIFNDEKINVKIPIPGEAGIQNASAAACIGFLLDIATNDIKDAIEKFKPSSEARMEVKKIGKNQIICDYYNSNPASLLNALDVLKNGKESQKIAILGDMFELGENSVMFHTNAINKALDSANIVLLLGDIFKVAFDEVGEKKGLYHFSSKDQISEFIKNQNYKDSLILIKGSRGMKMEDLIGSFHL